MHDIVDLVRKISKSTSSNIKVCLPGIVQEYDFKTQRASIKIDIKEVFEDGSDIDYPVITGVPVIFTATSLASITIPVTQGDSCLVLFADRDISNWLLGASGEKPNTIRMHNLSDAIAIIGLMQYSKVNNAENNDDLLIRYKNGKIRIKDSGKIEIITDNDDIEITTQKDIKVNCNNAAVTAENEINVIAGSSILITAEDIDIASNNDINIIGAHAVNINSPDVTINAENAANINCVSSTITATGNVELSCVDASITASGNINTTAVSLVHTGNLDLTGNLTINGNVSGFEASPVIFTSGITNTGSIVSTGGTISSNGIVLDTHTHLYSQPVVGSTPTAAIPALTATPT